MRMLRPSSSEPDKPVFLIRLRFFFPLIAVRIVVCLNNHVVVTGLRIRFFITRLVQLQRAAASNCLLQANFLRRSRGQRGRRFRLRPVMNGGLLLGMAASGGGIGYSCQANTDQVLLRFDVVVLLSFRGK